jgi:hypothetical protein
MSQNIVVTFTLLFGASIALICAVYVALNMRKKRKSIEPKVLTEEIN